MIILKARREGVSTRTTGKIFWKVANNFNRYGVLVTHEPEATDFLFKMQKRYYDHLPSDVKPETKYNNTKMLEFNNKTGTGLDSAIRVGTAGKDDFGSGQLIHYLHLSEVPKWPANTQKDLLTSLLQCVPPEPDTIICFEGTAKGIGGEFYTRFWSARYRYEIFLRDGKPAFNRTINPDADINNEYSSIFIPWFVFAKYQMLVPADFRRTESEQKLVEAFGITDGHLQWRRWAIENLCNGSEDIFKQEYPSIPEEAFLSSGRPVFDNVKVLALKKAALNPFMSYDILLGAGQFIAKKDGSGIFKVWKEPVAGRNYVVSADVAEGLETGDFSSADVIDGLTGEQCAHWHGKIDADQFAIILSWIAKRYNMAFIVPERNNHGMIVCEKLTEQIRYPKVYVETIVEPPHRPRKRYGWITTKASKPLVIDNLIAEIREGTHGIRCAETFGEMMTFQNNSDGTMTASEGMYDDRVMSIAIGKYARLRLLKQLLTPSTATYPTTQAAPPPASAWT